MAKIAAFVIVKQAVAETYQSALELVVCFCTVMMLYFRPPVGLRERMLCLYN